jgi:hypothetical protein
MRSPVMGARSTFGPYSSWYEAPSSAKKKTQTHFRLESAGAQVVTGVTCAGISSPSAFRSRTWAGDCSSPFGKGMPTVMGAPGCTGSTVMGTRSAAHPMVAGRRKRARAKRVFFIMVRSGLSEGR